MNKESVVTTQLRIPASMHRRITEEAKLIGVSFNSHLLELAWLGMKFTEGTCPLQSSPQHPE